MSMPAAPKNLKELYTADMRDLWSANDQMQRMVQEFAQRASDEKIRQLFERSVSAIAQHTQALREMVDASDASPCAGMQGLVQEARQHALESDLPPLLRDLEMIAQYQRMSHYGIAGFGTAAAYAEALGLNDQAQKLRSIVSDIYKGDEYSSRLAENAERAAAQG
jgi:ferritin-like metal-binding protein YciE